MKDDYLLAFSHVGTKLYLFRFILAEKFRRQNIPTKNKSVNLAIY